MADKSVPASLPDLITSTDKFEPSELGVPSKRPKAAGPELEIASIETGKITGWDKEDWRDEVRVNLPITDVNVDNHHAPVLPGAQIDPDLRRAEKAVAAIIRDSASAGKPAAAICHAPRLLIEAGVVKGKGITSYKPIRADIRNAGAGDRRSRLRRWPYHHLPLRRRFAGILRRDHPCTRTGRSGCVIVTAAEGARHVG